MGLFFNKKRFMILILFIAFPFAQH